MQLVFQRACSLDALILLSKGVQPVKVSAFKNARYYELTTGRVLTSSVSLGDKGSRVFLQIAGVAITGPACNFVFQLPKARQTLSGLWAVLLSCRYELDHVTKCLLNL